jgi:hypothetical protein
MDIAISFATSTLSKYFTAQTLAIGHII